MYYHYRVTNLINRLTYCGFLALVVLLLSACTSGRWIVEEEQAVDEDDYRETGRSHIFRQSEQVSPDRPVLDLDVYSLVEMEYAEKILMQRYIQDYKLNIPFLVLGLAGAGTSFYLANSDGVGGGDGSLRSKSLNALGGVLAAGTVLNMKPEGEPRPTEEFQYLRRTGSQTRVDTARAVSYNDSSAYLSMHYGDSLVVNREELEVDEGSLQYNLAAPLEALELRDINYERVEVSVDFEDSTYQYAYPLNEILQPYAEVASQVTELRSEPGDEEETLMAELVEGSELKIVEPVGGEWFKVTYGISESYIPIGDTRIVWRGASVEEESTVRTTPIVPFGNIDVESNIPVLRDLHENGQGIILANENYGENVFRNTYALRDGRLMETYLKNALGYAAENLRVFEDEDDPDWWDTAYTELKQQATDSSEIVVYLNGIGRIGGYENGDDENRSIEILLPDGNDPPGVDLTMMLDELAELPARKIWVIGEIDFRDKPENYSSGEADGVNELLSNAISDNENMAFLLSARTDQTSGIYFDDSEEDYKHHIFTYYLGRALQQRRTTLPTIMSYLQQNVTYTSRRLHDRAQDPVMIGNSDLELVDE